jgi:hypothetical protein
MKPTIKRPRIWNRAAWSGLQNTSGCVINVYEAMVERLAGQKLVKLRKKPAPVPIGPRTESKAPRWSSQESTCLNYGKTVSCKHKLMTWDQAVLQHFPYILRYTKNISNSFVLTL